MQIIPLAHGRVRYVDRSRKYIIVAMTEPQRGSVFVPASVVNAFGTLPEPGTHCDLGDVCAVPRGWQASRIVKLHPLKKD